MDEIKLDIGISLPEHVIRDLKLSESTVFESHFDAKSNRILVRALADEDSPPYRQRSQRITLSFCEKTLFRNGRESGDKITAKSKRITAPVC